jgi:hypothetical protein
MRIPTIGSELPSAYLRRMKGYQRLTREEPESLMYRALFKGAQEKYWDAMHYRFSAPGHHIMDFDEWGNRLDHGL